MKSVDDQVNALCAPRKKKRSWLIPDRRIMRRALQWLAKGKTLQQFCKEDGMPNPSVLYGWIRTDPVYYEDFKVAICVGHDMIAQECLEIADSGNVKDVAHRKLQIETRLKLLAKWDVRYGDTRNVKVSGSVDHKVDQMSVEEMREQIMGLVATARKRQIKAGGNRVVEMLN